MKRLALLLIVTILAVGCNTTKGTTDATTKREKNDDLISFEYEAITRGAYKKVIVSQDSIITIKDRDMNDVVSRPLGKAAWEGLVKDLNKINLDGIETLEAPSTKSHVDAALAASIKVVKKDKTYQSNSFDHGNPPAAIKSLVDKIVMMSDLPKK